MYLIRRYGGGGGGQGKTKKHGEGRIDKEEKQRQFKE